MHTRPTWVLPLLAVGFAVTTGYWVVGRTATHVVIARSSKLRARPVPA